MDVVTGLCAISPNPTFMDLSLESHHIFHNGVSGATAMLNAVVESRTEPGGASANTEIAIPTLYCSKLAHAMPIHAHTTETGVAGGSAVPHAAEEPDQDLECAKEWAVAMDLQQNHNHAAPVGVLHSGMANGAPAATHVVEVPAAENAPVQMEVLTVVLPTLLMRDHVSNSVVPLR